MLDNVKSQDNNILLVRSRLNAILQAAMHYPLVVVTAGAGYGKTRAVDYFLKNRDVCTVWLHLSESDNSKSRFWKSLCHSHGQIKERLGANLSEFGFPDGSKVDRIREIIEDEMVPGKQYVLVFDDFHLINNPDVLQFVERLLVKQQENVTVFLISRTEPPINIMPHIMKDQISFITEDDLRFTHREIEAFFDKIGIELSADSIANIYEDTQGWAFAVNLIGLSLRKAEANENYARAAMKINVFKLIEAEVFSVASGRLQSLLVRMSLIEHLSAPLVQSLAGDPALISELEGASAFIRYDNYLDTYRIHHLFLDFLVGKQGMLTGEDKRDTWRIAAEWCENNDFIIDAVSYYEKAGDYDKIVALIYFNFPQQIPFDIAEFLLRVVEGAPASAFGGVAIYYSIHMRLLLSLGRLREHSVFADNIIKSYEKKQETPDNCRILSSVYSCIGLSKMLVAPDTDVYDFDADFKRHYEYYEKSPFDSTGSASSLSIPVYVGMVGTDRKGAIEEYIGALERSVPYVSKVMNGCMSGADMLAQGELYFFRGDLRKADVAIKNALKAAADNGQHDIQNRALYYLLRIYLSQGNYDSVQSVIGQLEEQLENKKYHLRQIMFDIITSWYYGLMDQPGMIAGWLNDDFGESSLGEAASDFANLMKAWLFYYTKRYDALLDFVQKERGVTRFLYGKIEVKLLEVLCQYKLNNKTAAFKEFETAYALSVTNGLIMPFIELGKDMRTLTSSAKRYGKCKIPVEWLDNINRKSATHAKHLSSVMTEYRKANGLDSDVSLSPRETEILADLCDGLSRSEIAVQHGLSINTVKAVLNIIYLKLGAHNNADAIRIAVEKGMLKT